MKKNVEWRQKEKRGEVRSSKEDVQGYKGEYKGREGMI